MTDPVRIEPLWLDAADALAIHDRQLSEHGGLSGLRDLGLLVSALTRPVNRWHYGESDLCQLAASYAYGVARNHPFADGNKRTAWVIARLFIKLNQLQLRFDSKDAIRTMIALAAGDLSEAELAVWFRDHLAPTP